MDEKFESEEDRQQYFGWVTEFGAAPARGYNLLSDLSARAMRLNESFEFNHQLVGTFGGTDVVEISYFHHFFHFGQVASSSSQAFRRSVGVRCPGRYELGGEERHENIVPIQGVMETPNLPVFAVMYLKFSPVLSLCASSYFDDFGRQNPVRFLKDRRISPMLADQFVWKLGRSRALAGDVYGFWTFYERMLASISGLSPSDLDVDIKISPLVGLDSVDVVLLIRAQRLEQIAAVAWAMRNQRVSSYWPASEYGGVLRRARELVGEKVAIKHWDESPLFSGTTSIWGFPVRRDFEGESWSFGYEGVDSVAMSSRNAGEMNASVSKSLLGRSVVVFVSTGFEPGDLGASIDPGFHEIVNSFGEASGSARKAVTASDGSEGDGGYRFVMLFDRADNMVGDQWAGLARDVSAKEIQNYIEYLLEFYGGDAGRKSDGLDPSRGNGEIRRIWTQTSFGVLMTVSREDVLREPRKYLVELFRNRLSGLGVHLKRGEVPSWTEMWLYHAKRLGVMYSATNSMVNTISTVVEHLLDDHEEHIDFLDTVSYLIEFVKDETATPGEVKQLAGLINYLVDARGRRDHPLRLPNASLAIDGYAGLGLSRQAFGVLVEGLMSRLGISGKLMIMSSQDVGMAYETGPADCSLFRVSDFSLYFPVSWTVPHMMAHVYLDHAPAGEVLGSALLGRCKTSMFVKHDGDCLDLVLSHMGARLRDIGEGTPASPMCRGLAQALKKVVADMISWASFMKGSFVRTHRRFWLNQGLALVYSSKDLYGNERVPMQVTVSVLVRIILLNEWASMAKGDVEGYVVFGKVKFSDFLDRVIQLGKCDWSCCEMSGLGTIETLWGDPQGMNELCAYAMREDLLAWRDQWQACLQRLVDAAKYVRGSKEIADIFDQWQEVNGDVVASLGLGSFALDSENSWSCYLSYLDMLLEEWQDSADPWPAFISGRTRSMEQEPAATRLEHRRRSKDLPGVFASRRGAIFLEDGESMTGTRSFRSQIVYHRKTSCFIGELVEYARRSRFARLVDHLGEVGS